VRFLVNVLDISREFASPDEMAAIDAFNESLQASGAWIMAAGLSRPNEATVVDARDEVVISDGPHVVTDEWVSGFWLIEADSADAAGKLAVEASRACQRRVELRPLL
jgi:hypothetical protein